MSRITIDRERCMGSGTCAFAAPATFGLDEEATAIVLDPDGNPPAIVLDAARACPTQAITVSDG
jgi:ferredoxin